MTHPFSYNLASMIKTQKRKQNPIDKHEGVTKIFKNKQVSALLLSWKPNWFPRNMKTLHEDLSNMKH